MDNRKTSKTLIVYYSLEGNTAYAANRIAKKIGADTLRLKPVKAYRNKGLAKFVWGGKSAMMAEKPKLEHYDVDLAGYDRVIIGFPVWASNFAPPIRTFVEKHRSKLKKKELYAFACQGGRGAEKALAKLRKKIGIEFFEEEAVFIDPKKKHSKETDEAIDLFCEEILELTADEEKGLAGLEELDTQLLAGKAREYFSHWDYRKHAKFCTILYLSLYAFDMTVSYFICKKILDKVDEMEDGE